jgi:hypothetical protein
MGRSLNRLPGDGDASIVPPRRAGGVASCSLENMGFILAEALAEQKRVRDLLAQSRELMKQMQAD